MISRCAAVARLPTGLNSRANSTWTSARIRETFVSYFCEHYAHRFVLSSKAVPSNKSNGTYFTNAGMNQFKPIFLATAAPDSDMASYKRVVNSQKCVRVGGKHNDLQDVGRDGYHHTFFEMLGSWSFGDYFKREICAMSWQLLTDVYKLPRDRMYVTYFAGNKEWKLAPDEECRDMWLEIGVPENRILPYGVKENFWMMGDVGPCGPCSEIHYDHVGNRDASSLVNGNCSGVTELWNLVFMQYERQLDGTLRRLPKNHIDTGMGLERLTAILQNKTSNYDTDLFSPIIQSVHRLSGASPYTGKYIESAGMKTDTDAVDNMDIVKDTAYRIVADHIRMICVVIADGLLPGKQDLGHKLRQIMYRCFHQACQVLGAPRGAVAQLVDDVVASLGGFYPELRQNYSKIKEVIWVTENQYFAQAQREKKLKRSSEPAKLVQYKTARVETKQKYPILDQFLVQKLKEKSIPETDDSYKYVFSISENGIYEFDVLESRVVGIVESNQLVDSVIDGQPCGLLTERTNYYAEAGGQVSDGGTVTMKSGAVFEVDRVHSYQNYVLHIGRLVSGTMRTGDQVDLQIDQARRQKCTFNHTATHMLQAAIKAVLGDDVMQKGSLVGPEYFTFDFSHLGKLTGQHIARIQTCLDDMVTKKFPVIRSQMALSDAEELPGLVKLEGEVYPRSVNVIRIGDQSELKSVELCGGTHVTNTGDLLAVVITKASGVSQGTKRITAVTGEAAELARIDCARLREHVDHLAEDIKTKIRPDHWTQRFKAIDTVFSSKTLPKSERDDIYQRFDSLRAEAADHHNTLAKDQLKKEIHSAIESTPKDQFTLVKCYFSSSKQVLKVLTKLNLTCPVLVHGKLKSSWTCVAYVPKTLPFTAADWLNHGLENVTSSHHMTNRNPEYETVFIKNDSDYESVLERLKNFRSS